MQTVTIDRDRMTITMDGQTSRLSITQFEIVAYLSAHPGMIRSRSQMLHQAWEGGGTEVEQRAVDSAIKRLRKLGFTAIRSYRGGGYYWDDGVPVVQVRVTQ